MLVRALKVLSGVYLCGPSYLTGKPVSHCKMHYFSISVSQPGFQSREPAVARENSTQKFPSGTVGPEDSFAPRDRSLSKTVTLRDGQCKLR